MARIYGYWLSGKDHYAADREEAEQVLATYAPLRDLVRENRAFVSTPSPGPLGRLGRPLGNPDLLAVTDPTRPVAVILGAVPHFLDADTTRAVTMRYARKLAPGSCLIISVARCDDEGLGKRLAAEYTAATWHNHSPADIGSFFDGLELVGPGVTEAQTWGPGCPNPCYAAATATCWSA